MKIYMYTHTHRRNSAAGNGRGAHDDSGSVVRAQHWVESEQQEPVQPPQASPHCVRPSDDTGVMLHDAPVGLQDAQGTRGRMCSL